MSQPILPPPLPLVERVQVAPLIPARVWFGPSIELACFAATISTDPGCTRAAPAMVTVEEQP